jgi:hypothetical protein
VPNYLDEYLIKLGATVDQSGMNRFHNALKDATSWTDASLGGMAMKMAKVQGEIVAGFVTIGGAAIGLVDKVAMADQSYRLFAMHMYLTKDAARGLKIATDALGVSIEDATWDPELRARTRQLFADQRAMAPTGDFDAQMRRIRDVRFEFTRMEVEMQYLGMNVVQDFMRALGFGPEELLTKLRKFNDWVIRDLPQIAQQITNYFMPVWEDVELVLTDVADVLRIVGTEALHVVGALSNDDKLNKATGTWYEYADAVQKVSLIMAGVALSIDTVIRDVFSLISVLRGAMQVLEGYEVVVTNLGNKQVMALGKAEADVGFDSMLGSVRELYNNGTPLAKVMQQWTTLGDKSTVPTGAGRSSTSMSSLNVVRQALGQVPISTASTSAVDFGRVMASLWSVESGNNDTAQSKTSSAYGPGQLLDATAKALGVNKYDPAQNRAGSMELMRQLLAHYGGNLAYAVGGYHEGQPKMDAVLAGRAVLSSEARVEIAKVLGQLGKLGDINVGGITIHITKPNASAEEIATTTVARLRDMNNKQTQRNLLEASNLGTSY